MVDQLIVLPLPGGGGGATVRNISVVRTLLALTLAVPFVAVAQKPVPAAPKYDIAKEVTVKGTIDDVQEMPMAKGETGVHLMVKTSTETIEVRLCPSGFLKDFDVTFEKGQQIQVTGSRIKVDDKDVILAREVVSGNSTVVLRDKTGSPVWTWMKKG
jgi:hypothetical protein